MLILVFAGCTCLFVGFVMHWPNSFHAKNTDPAMKIFFIVIALTNSNNVFVEKFKNNLYGPDLLHAQSLIWAFVLH